MYKVFYPEAVDVANVLGLRYKCCQASKSRKYVGFVSETAFTVPLYKPVPRCERRLTVLTLLKDVPARRSGNPAPFWNFAQLEWSSEKERSQAFAKAILAEDMVKVSF